MTRQTTAALQSNIHSFAVSGIVIPGLERSATMKVYCYAKCGTCRKALKWLDDRQIEYEKIDIAQDHPDEAMIRELHKKSGLPLKRFYNTSGKIYKDLQLSKKLPDMSEDEQYRLLASDGMLVKRPLVIGDDFVLVGFKEPEWERIGK